jgi:hypothetical protein
VEDHERDLGDDVGFDVSPFTTMDGGDVAARAEVASVSIRDRVMVLVMVLPAVAAFGYLIYLGLVFGHPSREYIVTSLITVFVLGVTPELWRRYRPSQK